MRHNIDCYNRKNDIPDRFPTRQFAYQERCPIRRIAYFPSFRVAGKPAIGTSCWMN